MSAEPPYPAPAAEPLRPPGYPPAAPAPTGAIVRRQTVLFILLFLLLVGLTFFMPGLLLLSGDRYSKPAHVYRYFREGGLGMWGILATQMLVWAGLAGLGAAMIRGLRVPGSILFVIALWPFGVGLLGAAAGAQKVSEVISGESIDPSQKARILAMGVSELSNLYLYGGAASAFAMYLTALAAVLGLVTIDPKALAPAPSRAWIVAMPFGLVFAGAAVGARSALDAHSFLLDGLVILGLLTSGLLAAAGSRIGPRLVASRHDDDASRAFRQLLLAGVALGAAMLLADRALLAASIRKPLDAVSGASLDPLQRMAILKAEAVPAMRGRPLLMAVDALGALAAFVVPLAAARGIQRKSSVGGVVAGVAAALVAGLALVSGVPLDRAASSLRAQYEDLDRALAAGAITLPTGREGEGSGTETLPRKPELLVKRDGSVVDQGGRPGEDSSYSRRTGVAADASLTFDSFMAKAGPALLVKDPFARLGLVLAPATRLDFASLGPYAGFLGTDLLSFSVTLQGKVSAGLPPPPVDTGSYGSRRRTAGAALAVLPDGDVGRLVGMSGPTSLVKLADTLPLADDSASVDARERVLASVRARLDMATIVLAPAPTDTLGRIAGQLQALAASLGSPAEDLVITADRAALEAAPAASETPDPRPKSRPPYRRPGR